MDEKNVPRHSVTETRAHLALVAEELARRASLGYVAQQAKRSVLRGLSAHPAIIGGVAALLSGLSLFAILRKRRRAAVVAPVIRRRPTMKMLPRIMGVAKQSGQEAIHAYQRATYKKRWFDRWIGSAVGAAVLLGAVAVAARRARQDEPVESRDGEVW